MKKRHLIFSILYLLSSLTNFCSAQQKKDEFKIGIFWPPVWKYTNDEQYKILSETHVDIVQNVSSTDLNTQEKNLRMLELAHKYGMKVYVSDPRVTGSDEDIKAMVETYRHHPATGGYYIRDEPDSAALGWAIKTYRTIAALDPEKVPHVNLFPDFALKNYEHGYVERWIEGVGKEHLKYLSFDIYPYKKNGRLEKSYYNNLDIIRRAGLKYDVKTSSYLQSFGIMNLYRRPTPGEMRLNVYSNLAYGIKNPVWFCYATPTGQGEQKFMNSVIDSLGQKTDLYEPFKALNFEMKQLGKTLIHLDAKQVYHSGDSLWMGTKQPPADFIWLPADSKSEVILSLYRDRRNGNQYVMAVNKSFSTARELTFRINKSVKKVARISAITGKAEKAPFHAREHTITETFLPGEGKLYLLR
ncbi:hypothetical protein DYBT9275_02329 [Dyadobacter sp. CECT 9275]|uniref:Glycoside hydrolase family 42 N-terminal domain-containing protein n=1 Tax=Dyadobacter helix TaxID=2822344 RepID=A0A916NLB1_9BACT|nr:beta-galactosidase [Dyadobacter sp. CECT 9275]CAG4999862.1 hypothetical protein DYBT9275_02329 [Dyadobacter sp. CECT 9275]